jgi:hypothetical protein
LIIGVGHYSHSVVTGAPFRWGDIPEIVTYAAIVGLITGGSTLLFVYWFRHLVEERQYSQMVFNEITGGAVAGIIGGLVVGLIGGYWFGTREAEPPSAGLLVWGAVTGPIFVVLGALLYEFHGNLRNLWRALILAAVIMIFMAPLGIYLLKEYGIYRYLFLGKTETQAIESGLVVGAAVGFILGLQIGLTLLLYRVFEVRRGARE